MDQRMKPWITSFTISVLILTLSEICQSSSNDDQGFLLAKSSRDDDVDYSFLQTEMHQLFYPDPDQSKVKGKQFFPRHECSRLLEEFSQAAANYTLCGVQHARPVNLCLKCRTSYLKVIEKFQEMERFSQDGITCKDVLTKQDHLDIVTVIFNFIIDKDGIWSLGNCNNCYTDSDPTKATSNETRTYIQLLRETWNCFSQYANMSDIFAKKEFGPSTTDFTSLCGNCSESYYNTRKFFWETLVPNSKGSDYGSVCIDLKDAFNFTGYIWGVEFHCNTDLNMEAFWLLILIPFGVLVTITYGVPTIVIPLCYAIKHKILTLLAIPDHYDKAYPSHERDLSNLREFVDNAREDGHEVLAAEAEEKLKIEKELYRLIYLIDKCRTDETAGDQKHLEHQLFELLSEMKKLNPMSDVELFSNDSVDQVPFVEQLRRRRIEHRGQSLNQPKVQWSDYSSYLGSDNQDNYSDNDPLLVTHDD